MDDHDKMFKRALKVTASLILFQGILAILALAGLGYVIYSVLKYFGVL